MKYVGFSTIVRCDFFIKVAISSIYIIYYNLVILLFSNVREYTYYFKKLIYANVNTEDIQRFKSAYPMINVNLHPSSYFKDYS